MKRMIEKKFINEDLEMELTSFIDDKQNVWFKGKDVARILGYSDTKKAIKQHVSEENKIIQLIHPNRWGVGGGGGETPPEQNDTRGKYYTLINEPGFYELVFNSKLEAAKNFRQWVFTTVLPLSVNMANTNYLIVPGIR